VQAFQALFYEATAVNYVKVNNALRYAVVNVVYDILGSFAKL